MSVLEYTGERMVPTFADESTFWEHVERYKFASAYVPNRTVLDIACGEGYGAEAMRVAGAASVIGVDISPEAVAHARACYGLDAHVGSAEAIPIANSSVNTVISFETIEHLPNPEKFIEECCRVLQPGGILIISTPNRDIYRQFSPNNPFHCSELTKNEFETLLGKHFTSFELFGQRLPTPWFARVRGFGRFWRVLVRLFNPSRGRSLDQKVRTHVVDLCANPNNPIQRYFTSDSVRRLKPSILSEAAYLIAVATR